MSRNSITPSRAFLHHLRLGDRPRAARRSGPGRQSRTAQAQDAIGLGAPFSSTRHMRQLPAIDSRSWKQKRGISAPAASQAWRSVNSAGTSTSLLSTLIRGIGRAFTGCTSCATRRRGRRACRRNAGSLGEVVHERSRELVGQLQLRRLALAVEAGIEVAARQRRIGVEEARGYASGGSPARCGGRRRR